MTNYPEKGRGQVNLDARSHVSGMAEVKSRQILYTGRVCQVLALRWQTTPNWCGHGHITRYKFCPSYIFGIGEARHFIFRLLIDTQE